MWVWFICYIERHTMICHLMVGLPNLWASDGRIRDDHETNFVSTGFSCKDAMQTKLDPRDCGLADDFPSGSCLCWGSLREIPLLGRLVRKPLWKRQHFAGNSAIPIGKMLPCSVEIHHIGFVGKFWQSSWHVDGSNMGYQWLTIAQAFQKI